MRIQRVFILALVVLLAIPGLQVHAESYSFSNIHASVSLPDGVYHTVLTPENLASQETFIRSQGGTVEAWAADFAARGVLLKAYDHPNNRVLEITALEDVDAKNIFDINEHPSDVRAKYRLSHGNKGSWAVLGYRYDSISWGNFKGVGRFLQLRYAYRQGDEVVRRGFQRRGIRNGYTITFDMQVFGRQVAAKDNTALNKVFNTFAFTQILPVPPLPITLEETVTAPVETGEASFTLKGKTKPGAKLTAAVISFGGSASQVFEATANKAGNYSLPITLPGEDVYIVNLTISSQGLQDFSKSYNIRYQKGLIPAQITSVPPDAFSADSFTITGMTSLTGVSATLRVNGIEAAKAVPRSGQFSFTFDTKAEGAYDIQLILSKKGLNNRVFQYTAYRALSNEAKETVLRQSAASPEYAKLLANPGQYDGQMLVYDGTLIQKTEEAGEYLLSIALSKTAEGFAEEIVAATDRDPLLALNTPVRVYGQMVGLYNTRNASGAEISLPRLQISLITAR